MVCGGRATCSTIQARLHQLILQPTSSVQYTGFNRGLKLSDESYTYSY